MWKANLKRQFLKILPSLKISGFLILWSALFHSLTLSILLYGSLSSDRVSTANRLSTLNQFLSENQILFAALSSLSALLFFRDPLVRLWRERVSGLSEFSKSLLRGLGFGVAITIAFTLNHDYQYLGFTTQLNLNFLASYAWILRALLIFIFVFSTEFLVRVVLSLELKDAIARFIIGNLTLLILYWIWFDPKVSELITLALFFSLFSSFWMSTGFLSSLFILIHAIFGLNFFENEFVGILQFKALRSEEGFFQNTHLQITLIALLALVYYTKLRVRKESTTP